MAVVPGRCPGLGSDAPLALRWSRKRGMISVPISAPVLIAIAIPGAATRRSISAQGTGLGIDATNDLSPEGARQGVKRWGVPAFAWLASESLALFDARPRRWE